MVECLAQEGLSPTNSKAENDPKANMISIPRFPCSSSLTRCEHVTAFYYSFFFLVYSIWSMRTRHVWYHSQLTAYRSKWRELKTTSKDHKDLSLKLLFKQTFTGTFIPTKKNNPCTSASADVIDNWFTLRCAYNYIALCLIAFYFVGHLSGYCCGKFLVEISGVLAARSFCLFSSRPF